MGLVGVGVGGWVFVCVCVCVGGGGWGQLSPPRQFNLETAMAYIQEDEILEVRRAAGAQHREKTRTREAIENLQSLFARRGAPQARARGRVPPLLKRGARAFAR